MTSRKVDWSKRTAKKSAGTTVILDDLVTVPVSADQAWKRVSDVHFVASCLPGLDPATLREAGENIFLAKMVNSVMGIDANWDLKATLQPNQADRSLKVIFDGEDRRLNMKMDGGANVVVRTAPEGASLDYDGNIRIDGSLAAMGGPIIRSIVRDALAQFVSAVAGQEKPTKRSRLRELKDAVVRFLAKLSRRSG